MYHAGVVHFRAVAQEFVGIENDLVPAAVAVLGEIERQQAGLHGDDALGGVVDIGAAGSGKRLVVDEQAGGLAQARPLVRIESAQDRQARQGRVESVARNQVALEDARATPAAEPAHASALTRRHRAGAYWPRPDARARPARSAGSGG